VLTIALSTLRMRWVSFAGTFVALTLGVGLIAAMGLVLAASVAPPQRLPQRFVAASLVVAPNGTLTVSTAFGPQTAPLAESPGLAPGLVASVAGIGPVVPDRSFYAQASGMRSAGDPVGHGWSSALPTGYALTAGSAPARDTEVVVSGGARPGDQVRVRTAAGLRAYTVSGVVPPRRVETATFFTDAEAARLSPRIDALIVDGPVDAVRAAVGNRARVLTGTDLSHLDPGRDRDADALNDTNALVGIAGGFAAFVAIFVVASTFGYSVVQRRREFALLRATGATPGQVRRMLLGEAALVSAAAAVLGCALGAFGAPRVLDWLIGLGMAPQWLPDSHSWVPLAVAFVTGPLVALSGVAVASWRAGRVRPAEAMREATVDTRAMPAGRWLLGAGTLAAALVMLVVAMIDAESATSDKSYMPTVMVLVVAFGLLAPVAVAPLARVLTRPLRGLAGATGMLVRQSAVTAVRRTATTAAPVLVTVGLTALLGGAAGTINAAEAEETDRSVLADYIVRPAGAPGLTRAFIERVRVITGVDVAAPVPTSVYNVHVGAVLVARPAQAVQPLAVQKVLNVHLLAGSMADLDDESVVVPGHWGKHVGDVVDVWLADGTPARLRVAGVLADGPNPDAYVTPKYSAGPAPLIYVKLRPGADPEAVEVALRTAGVDEGATVVSKREWSALAAENKTDASRLGLFIVLGIVLCYTAIAIVNTVLMASSERAQDIATLRLSGATPTQVVWILVTESLLAVAVGVLLAATATCLGLAGLWVALLRLVGPTAIVMPWWTLAAVTGCATTLATLATVIPVVRLLRRPSIELAGLRE
jgi:putative ABC transport system permease protein